MTMGALCWVLPPEEEDREMLEEEEQEGGEGFPGVGLVERLVGLVDEAACCLNCQRPTDRLILMVNGQRERWFRF